MTTRLDPADTIARVVHCDDHYGTLIALMADGQCVAVGHGRRPVAALAAHARSCGDDPRATPARLRRRWATFRLAGPDDGDFDWCLDWDNDEYPDGTPVTMLTATTDGGAR